MERRLKERLDEYYKFLAISVVHLRNRRFWMYHRTRLKDLGHPLNPLKFGRAILRGDDCQGCKASAQPL